MSEIENLKQQNRDLIAKLEIAKKWMASQVQENMRRITSEKILGDPNFGEDLDNLDEKIEKKIYDFFVKFFGGIYHHQG